MKESILSQKSPTSEPKVGQNRSLSQKLAQIAGGGGAAAMAGLGVVPQSADAAIVSAAGVPISPPTSFGVNNWDVDGDGTNDFGLRNAFGPMGTVSAGFTNLNGGRLVVPVGSVFDGISKLPYGQVIGMTLGTAYKFHDANQGRAFLTENSAIETGPANGGWSYGDTGYFGFKFTTNGGADTHYGWGQMFIGDRGNAGAGDNYEILQAYYNDVAGESVMAGVVPEPSSTTLLALGAAGLVMWRRRRRRS